MASICAIIGLILKRKQIWLLLFRKIRSSSTYGPLVDINDYLRFEVLQKDYDEGGNQYNNWSLRGVRDGMPPVTAIYQILIRNGNPLHQKRIDDASIENGYMNEESNDEL